METKYFGIKTALYLRAIKISKNMCPPVLWTFIRRLLSRPKYFKSPPTNQDLEVYWNPKEAALQELWAEGTAWQEIQYFIANCKGKVLDIACGGARPLRYCRTSIMFKCMVATYQMRLFKKR